MIVYNGPVISNNTQGCLPVTAYYITVLKMQIGTLLLKIVRKMFQEGRIATRTPVSEITPSPPHHVGPPACRFSEGASRPLLLPPK